jgi:hypothetical protein
MNPQDCRCGLTTQRPYYMGASDDAFTEVVRASAASAMGKRYAVTQDPPGLCAYKRYLATPKEAQNAREWRGAESFHQELPFAPLTR